MPAKKGRPLSLRLFRSIATTSAMTLISRVLGFVRDIVIANFFGASYLADAFFVAFRIPNFFRRLFAEGSFSQAFIPVLAEYKTQRPHQDVKALVERVAGTLAAVLLAVTILTAVAAPVFVLVFAPGFSGHPEKAQLTAEMLRVTFPYLLFISLAAFAGSILNTYGRFGVPAFTPVFLNLSLIGAAFWLGPHLAQPAMALAWGVFIGGVAQLAFQLPFLKRLGLLPRPRFGLGDPGVLGANNIANVMGVFVPVSPFTTFRMDGWMTFTSVISLFCLSTFTSKAGRPK